MTHKAQKHPLGRINIKALYQISCQFACECMAILPIRRLQYKPHQQPTNQPIKLSRVSNSTLSSDTKIAGQQSISHLCSKPNTRPNQFALITRSFRRSFPHTAISHDSVLFNTIHYSRIRSNPYSNTIRSKDKVLSMSAILDIFSRGEF